MLLTLILTVLILFCITNSTWLLASRENHNMIAVISWISFLENGNISTLSHSTTCWGKETRHQLSVQFNLFRDRYFPRPLTLFSFASQKQCQAESFRKGLDPQVMTSSGGPDQTWPYPHTMTAFVKEKFDTFLLGSPAKTFTIDSLCRKWSVNSTQ